MVKSNKKIYYRKSDKYNGWLIIPEINKWIDFNTEHNYKVKTTKITDNEYNIKISGIKDKKLKFQSIGDLNVNCVTYLFDILNLTDVSDDDQIENEVAYFGLIIQSNVGLSSEVQLIYNGTRYPTTKNGNIYETLIRLPNNSNYIQNNQYYFNYTINSSTNTIQNITVPYQFNTYMVAIGLCDGVTFNETAYNLTFYDEETITSPSQGQIAGNILVWLNQSHNRTYLFNTSTESHSKLICIFPQYANYTVDGILDYYNSSSTTKSLVLSEDISNTTINYDLYLIYGNATDRIIMTVLDNDAFVFPDVLVTIQRYIPATNSYIEQDQQYTDFQGQVLFNAILYTDQYRFIFEYPVGTIVDTSTKATIKNTNIQYQLILDADTLGNTFKRLNITGSITYDNTTNIASFDYIDPTDIMTRACINAWKLTGKGRILYNSTCSSVNPNTISIGISNNTGEEYYIEGIAYASDPQLLDTLRISFAQITDFGIDGLFWLLVFTIAISLLLIESPILFIIFAPLPFVLFSFMGYVNGSQAGVLNGFDYGIAVTIMVVFWMVGFYVRGGDK